MKIDSGVHPPRSLDVCNAAQNHDGVLSECGKPATRWFAALNNPRSMPFSRCDECANKVHRRQRDGEIAVYSAYYRKEINRTEAEVLWLLTQ